MTDPGYRCPECDTYSGTFTLDNQGNIIHSTCGRAGTPASFTRGTVEYEAIYEADDYDENTDEAVNPVCENADCGNPLLPDDVDGLCSYCSEREDEGGPEEEAATALNLAATALNLAALSPQTWCDLAPHLTCAEAETVKAFLLAWRDRDGEHVAQVFMEAHALGDDDPEDLHYQG